MPVLFDPDVAALAEVLGRGAGLVFVLTNSRSLSEHAAVALTRRLVRRVVRASRRTGRAVTFV
ncbi:MAG TPA: hypothetical protein VD763_13760, partial [Candidatus Saccharimonadales bacterium]|nr:hypothetical protein [Candidatus Saccharimonadales bacterium]